MLEFKEQWRLVIDARDRINKKNKNNAAKGFVNLIRFYLRSKSQKHIRNVIYLGIMDWEVLVLFGRLLGHEVKLPDGFEKDEVMNKVLSLDLSPITFEDKK